MKRTKDGEQLHLALTRENVRVIFKDREYTVKFKTGPLGDLYELRSGKCYLYNIWDVDVDTARFDYEQGAYVIEGNRTLKVLPAQPYKVTLEISIPEYVIFAQDEAEAIDTVTRKIKKLLRSMAPDITCEATAKQ